MERLLWIGVGGGLGSMGRYAVHVWVTRTFGTALPWGTFAVNFLGSFLLGALVQLLAGQETMNPNLKLSLTVGVLGGFTTYSTFSEETWRLLHQGSWTMALANVLLTVLACLLATGLGFALATRWTGA